MNIVFDNGVIKIYRHCLKGLDSNMYLLLTNDARAIVIDPCVCDEAITILMDNNIRDVVILLTHEHFDHISGVNFYRLEYEGYGSVQVICNDICAENIENPEKNLAFYWDVLIGNLDEDSRTCAEMIKDITYSCNADILFRDSYEFCWGNCSIKLKSAPGHSKGGSLIFLDGLVVFTGDNLTNGNGVICRWPGGSKAEYIAYTMPMICSIDASTLICPGHGECGYISELIRYTEMYRKKG